MFSLHPDVDRAPIDPGAAVAAESRPSHPDRPWVLTNMITSADGATAVNGVSGPLGGPADGAMFSALRGVADAIVVGASTVREERYRPPTADEERTRARRLRGQQDRPLIAVITGSLDLPLDLPLFADVSYRPLIITSERAPEERRTALEPVADVVDAGAERVDLGEALRALAGRGHGVVLAEGGPGLNGQLIADDLIDEWNLTVSPLLAAGDSARPAHGRLTDSPPRPMRLDRVWLADDLLFCRWVRHDRA